jgi:hypothetical protein
MNDDNKADSMKPLVDELRVLAEGWRNSTSDPHNIANAVMVALQEVSNAIVRAYGDHPGRHGENYKHKFEVREKALRDIKAVHTRWYHHAAITAEDAAREMEEIAVSVWQREPPNDRTERRGTVTLEPPKTL